MLSMFAFNFNLRRHNKVIGAEAATPTIEVDREGKVVETTVKTLFMRKSLKVRGRTFTPGAPRLVPALQVLNYEGVSNFAFNVIVRPRIKGGMEGGLENANVGAIAASAAAAAVAANAQPLGGVLERLFGGGGL